ncbi:hypothetical protein RHMOL_Rhmol01G0210600 [Rhododendron molle]|uniref:Uncharacterized protein n=1 Tax=Rhododendron molle TaxID=49168 RepID=A0ACC0Q582_RHOML|nr:hypothetical protein RHMOL_Rhmol01G0210600 [Rhododendron molle]
MEELSFHQNLQQEAFAGKEIEELLHHMGFERNTPLTQEMVPESNLFHLPNSSFSYLDQAQNSSSFLPTLGFLGDVSSNTHSALDSNSANFDPLFHLNLPPPQPPLLRGLMFESPIPNGGYNVNTGSLFGGVVDEREGSGGGYGYDNGVFEFNAERIKRHKTESNGPDHQDQSSSNGLRSSWLQRKFKDCEIDIWIVDDEVTIKFAHPQKKINCLLPVSKALDELQLDIQHVGGGLVVDNYCFLFNSKICEGSSVYASAIANKIIEVVDKQSAPSSSPNRFGAHSPKSSKTPNPNLGTILRSVAPSSATEDFGPFSPKSSKNPSSSTTLQQVFEEALQQEAEERAAHFLVHTGKEKVQLSNPNPRMLEAEECNSHNNGSLSQSLNHCDEVHNCNPDPTMLINAYPPNTGQNRPKPRNWAALLQSQSPSLDMKLDYFPDLQKGKAATVEIDVVLTEVGKWNKYLIGHFLDGKMAYPLLVTTARNKWKDLFVAVKPDVSGFYLFEFKDEQAKMQVLEGGPYFFSQRYLVLKEWHRMMKPLQEQPTKIPVWVKFHDLPFELWNQECLSRVASTVGRPIHVDQATARTSKQPGLLQTKSTKARVCIEISAEQDFPDEVAVTVQGETVVVPIEYQVLPPMCSHCHVFGHSTTKCVKHFVTPSPVLPVAKDLEWKVVTNGKLKVGELSSSQKNVQGLQAPPSPILQQVLQENSDDSEADLLEVLEGVVSSVINDPSNSQKATASPTSIANNPTVNTPSKQPTKAEKKASKAAWSDNRISPKVNVQAWKSTNSFKAATSDQNTQLLFTRFKQGHGSRAGHCPRGVQIHVFPLDWKASHPAAAIGLLILLDIQVTITGDLVSHKSHDQESKLQTWFSQITITAAAVVLLLICFCIMLCGSSMAVQISSVVGSIFYTSFCFSPAADKLLLFKQPAAGVLLSVNAWAVVGSPFAEGDVLCIVSSVLVVRFVSATAVIDTSNRTQLQVSMLNFCGRTSEVEQRTTELHVAAVLCYCCCPCCCFD